MPEKFSGWTTNSLYVDHHQKQLYYLAQTPEPDADQEDLHWDPQVADER